MSRTKLYATIGTETREFTEAEYAQFEKDQEKQIKDADTKTKLEQAAQVRKQIILDRLGITGDEFNALLS